MWKVKFLFGYSDMKALGGRRLRVLRVLLWIFGVGRLCILILWLWKKKAFLCVCVCVL